MFGSNARDGSPRVDYSEQQPGKPKGSHAEQISLDRFRRFLEEARGLEFDVMLEIKDKEKSALEVAQVVWEATRSGADDGHLGQRFLMHLD